MNLKKKILILCFLLTILPQFFLNISFSLTIVNNSNNYLIVVHNSSNENVDFMGVFFNSSEPINTLEEFNESFINYSPNNSCNISFDNISFNMMDNYMIDNITIHNFTKSFPYGTYNFNITCSDDNLGTLSANEDFIVIQNCIDNDNDGFGSSENAINGNFSDCMYNTTIDCNDNNSLIIPLFLLMNLCRLYCELPLPLSRYTRTNKWVANPEFPIAISDGYL